MERGQRLIVEFDGDIVSFLESRGAFEGGPVSRDALLRRKLEQLASLVEDYDVRQRLDDRQYAAALELLPNPWSLKTKDISQLSLHMAAEPHFEEVIERLGIDRLEFESKIAELSLVEKVSLVDHAERVHSQEHRGSLAAHSVEDV
jgi:hypothetical protein